MLAITLLLFVACKSDGSEGGTATTASDTEKKTPTISYTGSPYTFYTNVAISTQTPTITGSNITGCSVAPTLPTGLTLNATTCAISGTATATQVATTHTVTVTNADGNGTTTISVTVTTPPAPTVSYSGSPFMLVMGQAMTAINASLSLSGLSVTGCTVSPALPSGMSISNTTCNITGTPTVSANATSHTITVSTSSGSGTATISILTGKRIFVTATAYNGNLGGISGADAKCASDTNKPATGTYKAYIIDGTNRRVCSVNWCSDASQFVDWVTTPNRNYIRADQSLLIGQGGPNGILSSMTNGIGAATSSVWTGFYLSYTTASSGSCNEWTSSSAAVNGNKGDAQSTGNTHFNDSPVACNNTVRLYCVEQ